MFFWWFFGNMVFFENVFPNKCFAFMDFSLIWTILAGRNVVYTSGIGCSSWNKKQNIKNLKPFFKPNLKINYFQLNRAPGDFKACQEDMLRGTSLPRRISLGLGRLLLQRVCLQCNSWEGWRPRRPRHIRKHCSSHGCRLG